MATVTAPWSRVECGARRCAQTQLEQQVGVRPDIDCEDDLPAEEGATITCALTVDGEDGVYDVTVTTTSVEDDTARFEVQVADSPR